MSEDADTDHRIVLAAADWDAPAAGGLRNDQQAELRRIYGGDIEPGPKPSSSDVKVFVLAWEVARNVDDGAGSSGAKAVGCGGLRPLDDTSAEIKRMYVRPSHRGRGLSRRILTELESTALGLGWSRLMLETGPAQIAAMGLYQATGYRRIANFGAYRGNPASLCFEKALNPPA